MDDKEIKALFAESRQGEVPDFEAMWGRAQAGAEAEGTQVKATSARPPWSRYLAVAAILCVLAIGWVWMGQSTTSPGPEGAALAVIEPEELLVQEDAWAFHAELDALLAMPSDYLLDDDFLTIQFFSDEIGL